MSREFRVKLAMNFRGGGGSDRAGFSLIEVSIALGIIGFTVVAILGLIPVGLTAAKSAVESTKTSLIAQDVYGRLHNELSTDTVAVTPTGHSLRWNTMFSTISYSTLASAGTISGPMAWAYYDSDGCFVDQLGTNANFSRNFYKASIYIQPLQSYPANLPSSTGNYPYLSVVVEIGWPAQAQADGSVVPASDADLATYTFYLRKP
jgi:type II secretory pathway pseudopilin PulG